MEFLLGFISILLFEIAAVVLFASLKDFFAMTIKKPRHYPED
jgi:hypothetical protein